MKFGHLKIGTAFEFGGEMYVKTSPLIGRNESDGTQKFFRRAMEVVLHDADIQTNPLERNRGMSQTEVNEAFADFYSHCERCLQELAPQLDATLLQRLRGQLENAKQEFIAKTEYKC
jgi:hypothetical protein